MIICSVLAIKNICYFPVFVCLFAVILGLQNYEIKAGS